MTQQEVCRALSEKLEPDYLTKWWEDLQFWDKRHYDAFMGGTPENTITPCNFFESEEASARLLEAMGSKESIEINIKTRLSDETGGILKVIINIHWLDIHVAHKDRKTAIVLAACKMFGIEVGEVTE